MPNNLALTTITSMVTNKLSDEELLAFHLAAELWGDVEPETPWYSKVKTLLINGNEIPRATRPILAALVQERANKPESEARS